MHTCPAGIRHNLIKMSKVTQLIAKFSKFIWYIMTALHRAPGLSNRGAGWGSGHWPATTRPVFGRKVAIQRKQKQHRNWKLCGRNLWHLRSCVCMTNWWCQRKSQVGNLKHIVTIPDEHATSKPTFSYAWIVDPLACRRDGFEDAQLQLKTNLKPNKES